jgi:hypothetical protein
LSTGVMLANVLSRMGLVDIETLRKTAYEDGLTCCFVVGKHLVKFYACL